MSSEWHIRQARETDIDDIVGFTSDTWGEKEGDYMPERIAEWVRTDGPTQRTFVAEIDDTAVGVCQAAILSDWEAWAQGMRVASAHRGRGIGSDLLTSLLQWAHEQGAVVARNMVFSWNVMGLGQSRAHGFEPCTEFRFAMPDPVGDAAADSTAGADPSRPVATRGSDTADAAWALWAASSTQTHLEGLVLDGGESWALSKLTRSRLQTAADDGRLITVTDGDLVGFTWRLWVKDIDSDEPGSQRRAVYPVAVWESPAAAAALFDAVARDAAAAGANETHVLIPETVAAVSDVATARVPVSDEPEFALRAELTDPAVRDAE